MALQKLYPKEMMPDFASSKTCKKKLCFYKENQSYLCPANIRSRFSVPSIIVYNHLSINFGFLELGLQSVKDGFPPAMNIICCWLVSQLCPTVFRPMDCTARQAPLLDFSGKNTGVGCRFLLKWIFPTQGFNPHLLHYKRKSKLWVF